MSLTDLARLLAAATGAHHPHGQQASRKIGWRIGTDLA